MRGCTALLALALLAGCGASTPVPKRDILEQGIVAAYGGHGRQYVGADSSAWYFLERTRLVSGSAFPARYAYDYLGVYRAPPFRTFTFTLGSAMTFGDATR